MQPESGAGSTHADGHRDAGDVADTDGTGHRGGESLELRDLTRVSVLREPAAHQRKCVAEAADVDEAQISGEEQATGDQPDHDERHFGAECRHGIEDESRYHIGNRTHGRVDGLVDVHPQSCLIRIGSAAGSVLRFDGDAGAHSRLCYSSRPFERTDHKPC